MSIFKNVNEHSRERIVTNKKFLLTNNSDGINSYQLRENSNNISGSYWDSIRALCYFSASTYNSGSGSDLWSTKKYGNPYHSIKIKGPDGPTSIYPQYTHKFYSSASIITIPQKYFGEQIKRGTVELIDKSNNGDPDGKNIILKDDGRGNLYASKMIYNSQSVTHASSSDNYIGNVFYNQGLITITDTGSYSGSMKYQNIGTGNFDLSFKSTQTIYVHRIECVVKPNEFNVTNNPTARALDNDNTKKTYKEPWKLSNNLTASGKHWSPYFTTIGLYGKKDIFPVAVARLSQAIKTRDDVTMRFVIRFDQW
jgi:hypothetical protein